MKNKMMSEYGGKEKYASKGANLGVARASLTAQMRPLE